MHTAHDQSAVEQLLCMLPGMQTKRAEVFSAALRSIFLSILYKDEIGPDIFDDTLRVLIRGVVIQLLEHE